MIEHVWCVGCGQTYFRFYDENGKALNHHMTLVIKCGDCRIPAAAEQDKQLELVLETF